MSRSWAACLLASLASAGVAQADVIHLRNGRTMEGQVVKSTAESIHLEVPGGRMVLPRAMVREVEERLTPEEELAVRLRELDLEDPQAVERLARWAASRGLAERARDLHALAEGVLLEQRVAAARRGTASDWVEVFRWAHGRDMSDEVQRWLLEQAQAADPADPSVASAVATYRAALSRQAAQEQRREREATERERARRRESARAHAARVAALEETVSRQRAQIEALEEQGEGTTIRRRRVIRRRRNVTICPPTHAHPDRRADPAPPPPTNGPIRQGPTPNSVIKTGGAGSGPIKTGGVGRGPIRAAGGDDSAP